MKKNTIYLIIIALLLALSIVLIVKIHNLGKPVTDKQKVELQKELDKADSLIRSQNRIIDSVNIVVVKYQDSLKTARINFLTINSKYYEKIKMVHNSTFTDVLGEIYHFIGTDSISYK